MKARLQYILRTKKVFLFDLDGTLYLGKKVIPGALDLVRKLRAQGKKIFFFTNNSSCSEKDYVTKLKRMGFSAQANEVVMSTHTLIEFLMKRKWKRIFLLGTPAMRSMLKKAGIQVVTSKPQAVVVGFDKTLTWKKLDQACKLVEGGVPMIWTHPDIFCPTDKGREPDCAAIGDLISQVTGKKPVAVLGKPNVLMLREVRKRSSCKKSETVLLGDRMSTDYEMAKKFGIDFVLVLSGETTRQDLNKLKGARPKFIVPSVKSLCRMPME